MKDSRGVRDEGRWSKVNQKKEDDDGEDDEYKAVTMTHANCINCVKFRAAGLHTFHIPQQALSARALLHNGGKVKVNQCRIYKDFQAL